MPPASFCTDEERLKYLHDVVDPLSDQAYDAFNAARSYRTDLEILKMQLEDLIRTLTQAHGYQAQIDEYSRELDIVTPEYEHAGVLMEEAGRRADEAIALHQKVLHAPLRDCTQPQNGGDGKPSGDSMLRDLFGHVTIGVGVGGHHDRSNGHPGNGAGTVAPNNEPVPSVTPPTTAPKGCVTRPGG